MYDDKPAVIDTIKSLCDAVISSARVRSHSTSIKYPRQFKSKRLFNAFIAILNMLGVTRIVTNRGSRLKVDDTSLFWHMAIENKCNEILSYVFSGLCRSGFPEYC